MLVSQGFCTQVLQIGWLKTTESYSLTVLEARHLNSSTGRAMLPLKALGKIASFQLLVVAYNPWCFLACSCFYSKLCLHLHAAIFPLCMFVFKFPPYNDNSSWIRTHLIRYDFILAKTNLQIRLHLQISGGRAFGSMDERRCSTQHHKSFCFHIFVPVGNRIPAYIF